MRRTARRFPLAAALITVVGVAVLLGLARAGASSSAGATLPAATWGVEVDRGYAGRLRRTDAASLRAAGVNTLLADARRLGPERSAKVIEIARNAGLTYLPIVATARASTTARALRAACASYRSKTGIRRCAVSVGTPRTAAVVARRGGLDAVVVRLPGPGALAALKESNGARHVIGVVSLRARRLTPTWQDAIRHAQDTRSVDLAITPSGEKRRSSPRRIPHDAPPTM